MIYRIGRVVPRAGARFDDPPVMPPLGRLPVIVNPAHDGRPPVHVIGVCRSTVQNVPVLGTWVRETTVWHLRGWKFGTQRAMVEFDLMREVVAVAGWPPADLARLDAGRFN